MIYYRINNIYIVSFSDDEQREVEGKSKIKIIVLIIGVGLFIFSLFNICFCTNNGCRSSIEAFLIGWLPMLMGGGASITWLANPFLIIAWVFLVQNKKVAWILSLIALSFSISFLKFETIIDNEAGYYNTITKLGSGYWFWLSSCFATFIGSFVLRIIKYRKFN